MNCPFCNAPVPENTQFCINCGGNLQQIPTQTPVTEEPWSQTPVAPVTPAPKPSIKKPLTILICLVAALALVVVLGLLTNWFGLVGPVDQIATATGRTLGAKSFTIEGTLYRKFPNYEWNPDTYESEYVGMETTEVTFTVQVIINEKEEDITLYGIAETEEGTEEILIYDGYCVIFYADGSSEYYDGSDEIEEFFESKEEAEKAFKELSKAKPDYEDVLDDLFGNGTYDELEEYVEFDEVKGCFRAVNRQLNKRSWLKKNLDYSTKRESGATVHIFHIDSLDFLEDLLPLAEPAFANREDYKETEDALEELDDSEMADIEVRFGIKGGKLSLLEFDVSVETGEEPIVTSISVEFFKIGRTKIDTKELEELLDEAIDAEETDGTEGYAYGGTYDSTYDSF